MSKILYNDNQRKFNLGWFHNSERNDKTFSLVAKLQAAGFKCIAKDESLKRYLYLDIDTKSYSTSDKREDYAKSTRKSLTENELNILLNDMIIK